MNVGVVVVALLLVTVVVDVWCLVLGASLDDIDTRGVSASFDAR